MKLHFSAKTTLICLTLAAGMTRASFWQWDRHQQKQGYIATLEQRLALPPAPLTSILDSITGNPESMLHRRVLVSGEYDYSQEVVLRNRRHDNTPGVFSIVPFKIEGTAEHVLVSRGFLPLSVAAHEKRAPFRTPQRDSFTGLVKVSAGITSPLKRLLAPSDPPTGAGHPRVDAWLRVDIEKIQKQIPYNILPVYLELMGDISPKNVREQVISTEAGREEMLVLPSSKPVVSTGGLEDGVSYPIPSYTTVVPPGRHLGYVFEWAFMALGTLLIGLLLQLRPPRAQLKSETSKFETSL
jgi:cytochrome oxidase assembly protein ShyY1